MPTKGFIGLSLLMSVGVPVIAETDMNHFGSSRFFYSNDTDGTSIASTFIGLSNSSSIVPICSMTYVEAGDYSGTNYGIGGYFDWSKERASINGYSIIARHDVSDDLFYMGDMNLLYNVNRHIDLSIGLFGDLVDTEKSLENGIVFSGYSGGFDLYNDRIGLATSIRQAFYSNDNTQNRIDVKGYVSVMDGIALYTSYRYFENSEPLNGMFWSPDEYDRLLFGVSFRKRFDDYLVYGYGEGGRGTSRYYFDDNDSYYHSGLMYNWKLNTERKFENGVGFLLTLGMDMNHDDDYHYRYGILQVTWEF